MELEQAGFRIIEQCPIARIDGIYHELNPFRLVVKFRGWRYYPSRVGRWLNDFLSRKPYFHPHMQAAIVVKDRDAVVVKL